MLVCLSRQKLPVLTQSQNQVEIPEHSHRIGRLNNGMTACPSPIYTVYPIQQDGRRPSTHTLLQYTSPEDRAFQESFRLQQEAEFERANNPTKHHSENGRPRDNDSDKAKSLGPSFQQTQGEVRRPSPRRTSTLLWYCCRSCAAPGPYLSFYDRCIGCETPRCDNCMVERVSTEEEVRA